MECGVRIFTQEMWLLFVEKNSKLALVFDKNEVKAGLVGQIPRSLRRC